MKKGKEVEHIYGFGFLGFLEVATRRRKEYTPPTKWYQPCSVTTSWSGRVYIYRCTLFLKNSLEGLTPGLACSR
jgi:hypothetical protein